MLIATNNKTQYVEIIPKVKHTLVDNCNARHRLIVGGRGKGASWSIARINLLDGMREPLFIPCVREVQKTIKYSVKKLLDDTIEFYGWQWFYTSTDTEIRGLNGTLFAFFGLHEFNADNIKSLEGADRCWVAEAQSMARRSISILRPTIRKDGAIFWWDINPRYGTDPVYVDYIKNDDPHAKVLFLNWRDNPWFGEAMKMEKESDYKRNEEEARHIWEGELRNEGELYVCPAYLVDLAVANDIDDLIGDWAVGADIAHQGGDEIVFYKRCGYKTVDKYYTRFQTVPDTTRLLMAFAGRRDMRINIDNGYVGAAVADLLEEKDFSDVRRINFGGKPIDDEHYADAATEMYYTLRDKFEYIDMPNDEELIGQLTQRQYKFINGRRGYEVMKIESKDDFAKHASNINPSPDRADGFVLCYYDSIEGEFAETLSYNIF